MPPETLRVSGYREFVRATDRAGRDAKNLVRSMLRTVGEILRVDAQQRFSRIDARSAAGFRVSVRQQGVFVQQSLRKTTGTRPDYGSLQMRVGLLAALTHRETDVEHAFEHALDGIADHFDS